MEKTDAQGITRAEGRPKVLLIVDSPGWAHDLKSRNLMRTIGPAFDIQLRFQAEVTAQELDQADLLVVYYWIQFGAMPQLAEAFLRNRHKLLVGVCSHLEFEGERREPGIRALSRLARGVFANSLLLHREFAPLLDTPVFYTPNGVDTRFFSPAERSSRNGPLRVGWAGSLANHGTDSRGFRDFIVPATAAVDGLELATAIREDTWRGPEAMRDWYRSLDVYLCASRSEGTPNPCLEAAACGVPLLTTRVGNMPEFVRDGVSGLFVERDVQDIAGKLTLLRDNRPLREFLGMSAREASRRWDWEFQAENYRAMFDAVLGDRRVPETAALHSAPSGEGTAHPPVKEPAARFSTPTELYLASADRMDRVLENVDRLRKDGGPDIGTYATVIGGLSGLNYLLAVRPEQIVFFDRNLIALEYARLMVDLIGICRSPDDFIGRMFCRPVGTFLAETEDVALTVESQERYLRQPVDPALQADTLSRLSPASRQVFEACVTPYLSGETLGEARNCRRLLPCWPVGKIVPVGGGEAEGCDESGARIPNTNTFFYGEGWLASPGAFLAVKRALSRADVRFVPADLLKQDLRCLLDPSRPSVLHVSNIDDWFPKAWARKLREWERLVLSVQGRLTVVTSHNGSRRLDADPHDRALAAVRPFAFGQIVEVTHKVPWGFHELDRKNVSVAAYLAHPFPADTTILHILAGEGVPRETVSEACRKAITQSRRVVVLEHNRNSADWRPGEGHAFVTSDELLDLLRNAAGDTPANLTFAGAIPGETDDCRNLLVVADSLEAAGNPPTPPHDARPAGYSFCIITNGKRPEKLAREIESIRALNVPTFEILVGGEVPPGLPDVTVVPLVEAAAGGRLGEMRNRLVQAARYDHIVVADDDMVFHEDFYEGLRTFGENYDVLCVRMHNPDGTRYWDWATCGGTKGHRLLDYDEQDPYVYPTGGLCILKAAVARRVVWDEARGFYQGEDVDFGRRLREAGVRIRFCRFSTVTHDDPQYTQIDEVVVRRADLLDIARDRYANKNLSEARYFLYRATRMYDSSADARQATEAIAREYGDTLEPETGLPSSAGKASGKPVSSRAAGGQLAPAPGARGRGGLQFRNAASRAGEGLNVAWAAPFLNFSGYGTAARDYVAALDQAGARVQAIPFNTDQRFIDHLDASQKAFWDRIVNRQIAVDTLIISSTPVTPAGEDVFGSARNENPTFRAHIGYTTNESTKVPAAWVDACSGMDEIWVPSDFNRRAFADSGLPEERIVVIPHGIAPDCFDPEKTKPYRPAEYRGFVFLSIFEWSLRKGWDVLLKAYHSCFKAKDDVTLAIRAYRTGQSGDWIRQQIARFQETLPLRPDERPHVVVLDRFVAPRDLPALYAGADAFVLPSRGEGWGLPYMEAMAMGLPTIGTDWGGNLDFMTPENSFLIDCKEELVPESGWRDNPNAVHYRGQVWAEPSARDLERHLWNIATNPDSARTIGRQARSHIVGHFTAAHAAERIASRLRERSRPGTTRALRTGENTRKATHPGRTAAGPRVLFQARQNVFSLPGGDTEVLQRLKNALEDSGVRVHFSSVPMADLASYDIVHIFNPESSFGIHAALQEKPFVVTPMYEDFGRYVHRSFEATALLRDYLETGDAEALERGLAGLRKDPEEPPAPGALDSFLRLSERTFASGAEEGQRIGRDFPGIGGLQVVPLGCNQPAEEETVSPEPFVAKYGVRDFILCVGRLETRKNQLMLQCALEDIDLPVVFVSGRTVQPEYENLCRRFRRKGKTIFTGRLTSDMLYSAFRAAKVHALPSWFELPGLVSLEAAWFGCNIVGTDAGTLRDYLGNDAFYCEPSDPASVRAAVLAAYDSPKNPSLRDLAAQYTWERTTQTLRKAYEGTLASCATPAGRRRLRDKAATAREEIKLRHLRERVLASCEDSPKDAVSAGSAILTLRPGDAPVHYAMGLARLRTMEYAEAANHLERYLRLDPFAPINGYLLLALALMKQERHAEAVACLHSASKRHPFMGEKAQSLLAEYLERCSGGLRQAEKEETARWKRAARLGL